MTTETVCQKCMGYLWVCENHPSQKAHECVFCDGAGMPCVCNPDAKAPSGMIIISEVKDD